jgi:hypothetical protein
LPLATLRLHQAGSGLYLKYVSLFQIAPFSSRALPGTQQIDGLERVPAVLNLLVIDFRSANYFSACKHHTGTRQTSWRSATRK